MNATQPKKIDDLVAKGNHSDFLRVMNFESGHEPKENETLIFFDDIDKVWCKGYYVYLIAHKGFYFSSFTLSGVFIIPKVTYWFYAGSFKR